MCVCVGLISPNTRGSAEIDRRIASAARAFGALRCIFDDQNLSLCTKRLIYSACVVSVLLYGSECWPVLRRDEFRIDGFRHSCLCIILVVSRRDQQSDSVTNEELRRRWGKPELLSTCIRKRRMEWLGHIGRMPDTRQPKQLLFGWLGKARPAQGPRLFITTYAPWIHHGLQQPRIDLCGDRVSLMLCLHHHHLS